MIPFLVSSQATDAVVRKLKTEEFRIGIDMIFKKRDKPYMNAVLFHEYISIVLFPHIAMVRSNPGLEHEPAVLLMDNCSVHMQDNTLQKLAAHRVKVVTFPSHTPNNFQSPDVSLFGVFKKRTTYKLPMNGDGSTTAFIRRIFHNMKQTVVADNV
jgi:hypothetical protein